MGSQSQDDTAWKKLLGATFASLACYVALLACDSQYGHTVNEQQRWILPIIGLCAAAFVPYWLAWRWVSQLTPSKRLTLWLVGTSVLFRLLLLPTPPFQEIDIYRYLWDGHVVAMGHNPYEYSPSEVLSAVESARSGLSTQDATLQELADEAIDERAYDEILATIHYGELPSPYPPVSQTVFAAADLTSPAKSATGHMIWLKLWLTSFDVATLGLVIAMLCMAGKHPGLAIAYGWCPLVLKEVAGSGHLDSIAIFFAMAAVTATMATTGHAKSGRWVALSALMLALGISAKLFPIVLAPLLVWFWLRKLAARHALLGLSTMAITCASCLWPMLSGHAEPSPVSAELQNDLADGPLPAAPDVSAAAPPETGIDKTAGLAAFLSRWEMNDLIFMVTLENLRDQSQMEYKNRAWFAFMPEGFSPAILRVWRNVLSRIFPSMANESDQLVSFLLARTITGGLFMLIALWLAYRTTENRVQTSAGSLTAGLARGAFLTLAWFWLLAPTQNPWYWCWAVPLLPFSKGRAWGALAALTLLYYLRFWLTYHMADQPVLGTRYHGELFFYFVVVWVEFAPWFVWLAGEWWLRLGRQESALSANHAN